MTRADPTPPREVFWIADSSGDRLLHVSDSVEQVFGLFADALIDHPLQWNHAVVPADAAALPRPFFLPDNDERVRVYRIVGGDLHTRWLRDRRFRWTDPRTGELRRCGIAEDITDQVQQRELQTQAPLPESWFATVAHELRAPLHAIQGWAHVLRQTEPMTPLKARAIDTIDRNVLAQARVVDELLDSQHWRDGSLRLDIGMHELAPLIDAAAELLRADAMTQQVRLEVRHDPSIGAVRGDRERLRLVMARLLANGVRNTAPGGLVRVWSERAPGLVRINVHDGNTQPLQLPLLLEAASSGDDPGAARHGSLGLPLVRRLVELHGGNITAHGDGPDRGSTVTVELPHRWPEPAEVQAGSSAPAEATVWNGRRVIVVDDERDARETLLLSLRSAGAEPLAFGDAAATFNHLHGLPAQAWPELLICDIGMPGENGYAFMRRLRRLEHERGQSGVPAVALTAFAGPASRERAQAAGFDQQLAKPLNPHTALATLAGALPPPHHAQRAVSA